MKLKKVIRLARIPVNNLPPMVKNGSRVIFNSAPNWEKIPIEVPASLSISSKIEKKITIYTQKLVFRTFNENVKNGVFAYLVSLSDGSDILIGTNERPFPVAETSQQLTASNGNSELVQYTVTYHSTSEIAYIR